MYKGASQNSQTRLDRGTIRDHQAAGTVHISKKDQEEQLRIEIARLESEIVKLPRTSAHRKKLGQRKNELSIKRHALKAEREGRTPSIDHTRILYAYRKQIEEEIGLETSMRIFAEVAVKWAEEHGVDFRHILGGYKEPMA